MTRLGVVVVVLLAACRPEPQGFDGGPCFVVEPRTDFDFGEVPSSPFSFVSTESFNVRNPTGTTRLITSSPPPNPFTIAPGTSRLFPDARETWSVSFVPTDALLHFGEVVLRDDHGCEVPVTLRGLGGGSLSSTPTLDFGFVAPGTEKTLDLVLVNTRRAPVVIDSLDLASNVFRLADATPTLVPAASTLSVRVIAAPTTPTRSDASLIIRARSTELVTFLSVSAGRPSAEVTPRALHGRTAPSVFLERSVVVRNNALPGGDGSEVLRLVPPFVAARAFDGGAVSGFSLRPQATLTEGLRGRESGEVVVHFDPPPTLGPAGGMISVFTNDPLQASIDVSFEVDVSPLETCSLAVSPQVLDLSAQGDGGSFGSLVFEVLDGGACVVDDVRLISGSAAGVRVVGDAGVGQRVAPFVVEVVAPTPSTRSRVGAVQFHVLQAGEVVRYVDVYSSP